MEQRVGERLSMGFHGRSPWLSLGPLTDRFYPILYGTEIRGAGNNVFVAIQGLKAPVGYAWPAGGNCGSTS
jgi:hypothetical protein